jgi:hypothetical protein
MGDASAGSAAGDDRSWMSWTLVGVLAIWIGVIGISLVSPDLVSGSQQDHLPLAAFLTWIWGLIGTIGFLWGISRLRGNVGRKALWTGLSITVCVIWGIALVLSALMPTWETGTDPTSIPVWAIVAPIAGALMTVLASVVAGIFAQPPA